MNAHNNSHFIFNNSKKHIFSAAHPEQRPGQVPVGTAPVACEPAPHGTADPGTTAYAASVASRTQRRRSGAGARRVGG